MATMSDLPLPHLSNNIFFVPEQGHPVIYAIKNRNRKTASPPDMSGPYAVGVGLSRRDGHG